MDEVSTADVKIGDIICGSDGEVWGKALHYKVLSRPRKTSGMGLLSGEKSECRSWMAEGEGYAVVNVDRTFYVERDGKLRGPLRSLVVELDDVTFILSIFDLNDDECIGWKLSEYPSRKLVFRGLFDVYPDIPPDSNRGMSDLVDMICESNIDWELAEAFWCETQDRLR